MNRKRVLFVFIVLALFLSFPAGDLFSQVPEAGADTKEQMKYFRVDKVITVAGTVTAIKSEKSYKSRKNDFIVAYLKDKKTGDQYKIEFSPAWYFNLDIMEGSQIRVTGSKCRISGQQLIMTQSIVFQGGIFHFRDKHGFPLWRGKGRKNLKNDRRYNRKRKRSGGDGKGRH